MKIRLAKSIFSSAGGKSVLALGDVMLDIYLTGKIERLSQEAPVPIIAVEDEKFFPGGAGNGAACMATIGIRPTLIAVVGGNERINYADILTEECQRRAISTAFIRDEERKTTIKMRLAATKTTKQHIARVDIENRFSLESKIETIVLETIRETVKKTNPLAISLHDYRKGFLTESIFQLVTSLSLRKSIPIFADLKQETFMKFRRFIQAPTIFFLKPNQNESAETARLINGFDKNGNDDDEIVQIGRIIQEDTPVNIIITRGARGAVLIQPNEEPFFVRPGKIEEQFDVAGAGDTVEAFLVAGYLGGATMPETLELAVAASQVAIRKFGTSVVTKQEVLEWLGKKP